MFPPAADELEVHIFGPGVGEAILIHIGTNRWIAIDSVEMPSGMPWALHYLKQIGVDPAAIEALVITHWHSDHIKGASKLFEAAPYADLYISSAGKSRNFVEAIAPLGGSGPSAQNAAGYEMRRLLETILERRNTGGRLKQHTVSHNMTLRSEQLNYGSFIGEMRLYAFSPSDADNVDAADYFKRLRKDTTSPIVHNPENHCSMVLQLEIAGEILLFGADREVHTDPDRGWHSVIESKAKLSPAPVSVFKIPHHGSENGLSELLWENYIHQDAIALIAPYCGGKNSLPDTKMTNRYASFGRLIYVTAKSESRKSQSTNLLKSTMPGMKIATQRVVKEGSIRLRKKVQTEANWEIELFGGAYMVKPSSQKNLISKLSSDNLPA